MKKRTLVLGMSVIMSVAMLTGCGTGKEDYLDDIKEITALSEVDTDTDDVAEMMEIMKDAIDDLDVSTGEAKTLKKDMAELVDYTSDLTSDLNALANMEEDELEEMQDKLEELQEKIEEDVQEFLDAAEEAGVEEEDLEDFDVDSLGL